MESQPFSSRAMVESAVTTMVWSRLPRNIDSSRPDRIETISVLVKLTGSGLCSSGMGHSVIGRARRRNLGPFGRRGRRLAMTAIGLYYAARLRRGEGRRGRHEDLHV